MRDRGRGLGFHGADRCRDFGGEALDGIGVAVRDGGRVEAPPIPPASGASLATRLSRRATPHVQFDCPGHGVGGDDGGMDSIMGGHRRNSSKDGCDRDGSWLTFLLIDGCLRLP